jgi:hypothetical protein
MDKGAGLFWIGAASLLSLASLAALEDAQPVPPERPAPLFRPAQERPASSAPAARSPIADDRLARIGTVQATERAWEARVEAIQRQLELARAGARTPADLAQARARLLDSHFSKDEQVLLDTYLAPANPVLTRQ